MNLDVEQDLLAKMRGGDADAFRSLFDAYWERVYAVCRHGAGSDEDGEELTQELFRNLWEKRASLEIRGPLGHYLMRAAKHAVLNLHRYRMLRHRKSEWMREEFRASAEAPDAMLERSQRMREMEDGLAALPAPARTVFNLMHRSGLPHKEIARILKISPKTVEYHLRNARAILRDRLRGFD